MQLILATTSEEAEVGSDAAANWTNVDVVVKGVAVDEIFDPASRLTASTFRTQLEILQVHH